MVILVDRWILELGLREEVRIIDNWQFGDGRVLGMMALTRRDCRGRCVLRMEVLALQH